ncbi:MULTISPECIES: hypothetical protein [Acidianus]|nr:MULTISPECIES: hypothetical protein [Acidianus]NON62128.1 hypothetical protein [Acidianus sp. RZ1]
MSMNSYIDFLTKDKKSDEKRNDLTEIDLIAEIIRNVEDKSESVLS